MPAGTYTITAQAIATDPGQAKKDPAGPNMPTWTGVSAPVNIRVNAAPTLSLTAPVAGSVFNPPASIAVSANAADADGSVAKVDFYAGTTLIGTATGAPYSITWANPAPGAYSLTAVATDSDGASTRSATVAMRVNAPPTVSLTSPANNAVFNAPASITLTAGAADADGQIAKVEFFQGTTLLATVTGAPYTYTWSGIAAGNYSLSARATDNDGAAATSAAVSVNVNAPPTVTLTAPANNAVISAPASITLSAAASDADGNIAKVDFYQGTRLIGTATAVPYSYTLASVAAGSYSYSAVATDNQGATTRSAAITVIVNAPPTVTLSSPANNAGYTAPAAITLTANAQDSDGTIAKVEFYQGATLIGTATAAPYSYAWQNVPAGSYSLSAVATDERGAATTSTPVSVRVNAAPTVAITAPANNAVFNAPASITLTASAADADGSVARVDFYQGTSLIGGASAAPFSVDWTNVAAGSYSVTALATDNLGATTTSAPVTVKVNAPPAVALTSPAGNASYTAPASITLTANAQDGDGSIAKLEFLQGTTVLATLTAAPYTFAWTNVAQGTYVLSARATDNRGATATSAAVTVSVNSGVAALYFIHPDHLNTPRLIADETGTTVWKWDQQEPFGNDTPNGDPNSTGAAFDFPLRFPGQYADKETGLAYNMMRDYDSGIGRYVQSDPIGLSGGLNTYLYVRANPLSQMDPSGLITPMGVSIGGFCILASGANIIHDLGTLTKVLEEINKANAKIKELEAKCPTAEAKAAIQLEIDEVRRNAAGLALQKGALGLRLAGAIAVSLTICPAVAAFF